MGTRPIAGILRATLFTGILTALAASLGYVLSSGAGIEWDSPPVPNLITVLVSVCLLCPITAVSCGPFGLLAGLVGSVFVLAWRREIRVTRPFLVNTVTAGLLLAAFYSLPGEWNNWPQKRGCRMLAVLSILVQLIGVCVRKGRKAQFRSAKAI